MSRILIFSGTTEGRMLAEHLSRSNVACDVCVATEYGSAVMEPSPLVTVHEGRLDAEGMRGLYEATGCELVVDATHPYAAVVTETILESLKDKNVEYIRLERRETVGDGSSSYRTATVAACVEELLSTEGNILLTTGTKDLHSFCGKEELRSRLIARVIPSVESLQCCYENGLTGRQIIAAQGPFTEETNIATIRQYDIRHLVMKESGKTGGADAKLAAAEKTGVTVHVISRPEKSGKPGYTLREVLDLLAKRFGFTLGEGKLQVALVGIGCGNEGLLTQEAREQIAGSAVIFGAERMLRFVQTSGKKLPYYRAEDILPRLQEIKKEHPEGASVSVLFSGDPGFYSGAEKLSAAFHDAGIEHITMPGISSMLYMYARLNMAWQDATVVSTHGVPAPEWENRLQDAVRGSKNVFLLTSGHADVKRIGALLVKESLPELWVYLGYDLSYPQEKIRKLRPADCEALDLEGLYVGVIRHG